MDEGGGCGNVDHVEISVSHYRGSALSWSDFFEDTRKEDTAHIDKKRMIW